MKVQNALRVVRRAATEIAKTAIAVKGVWAVVRDIWGMFGDS